MDYLLLVLVRCVRLVFGVVLLMFAPVRLRAGLPGADEHLRVHCASQYLPDLRR